METAETFEEKIDTVKATPRFDVAEPVETSAIASMKKIEKKEYEATEEKAERVLPVQEPLTVSETQLEEGVKEVPEKKEKPRKAKKVQDKKPEEKVTVTEVATHILLEAVHSEEVEEILKTVRAKEFGPSEKPLRELAQIGFLVRRGVTVTQIDELYDAEKFPALRTPEAQSAMVQVVDRKGFSPLITEVLTEESATDEKTAAKTVGFKAFMRMIELNYATVEETLTSFAPEDFKPDKWTTSEATEVLHHYNTITITSCSRLLSTIRPLPNTINP